MSVERYEPGGAVAIPTEREWAHLERVATMFSKSAMCPKQFKDKPADLMVVALSLRELDVPFTLRAVGQCYVIDNQLGMMAQLQVALAAKSGYNVWPHNPNEPECCGLDLPACDDEIATVHIRGRGQPMRTYSYTLDDARRYGLLDEWVEKWQQSQSGSNYSTKFVVAIDGVATAKPIPDWAKKEIEAGKVKHKDPWFKSRPDMLLARAVTRGLRYAAPEVLLGLGGAELDTSVPNAAPATQRPVLVEDDIADADLVETPETPDRAGKEDEQENTTQGQATDVRQAGEAVAAPTATTDNPSAAAADPASLFEQEDDPLVDAAYVQRLAIGCRDLTEGTDVDPDELRHALCYVATGGTVVSSKLLHRSQIRAVNGWFSDYRLGKAVLRPRIGEPGLTLVPLPDEEAPF